MTEAEGHFSEQYQAVDVYLPINLVRTLQGFAQVLGEKFAERREWASEVCATLNSFLEDPHFNSVELMRIRATQSVVDFFKESLGEQDRLDIETKKEWGLVYTMDRNGVAKVHNIRLAIHELVVKAIDGLKGSEYRRTKGQSE